MLAREQIEPFYRSDVPQNEKGGNKSLPKHFTDFKERDSLMSFELEVCYILGLLFEMLGKISRFASQAYMSKSNILVPV